MSDLQSYIPRRQKRISGFKNILRKLSKESKSFFCAFLHAITLYERTLTPSTKQLEFEDELCKEQVDQCKYIFENSIRRREKLETKAEKLLSLLLIFTPLFSALITYIFSKEIQHGKLILFFYIALGISIFSVLVAFISIFRARKVSDIEEPFLPTIVDYENDKIHKYSETREGLGYLYCAINNQVRNDHVADFVRAAEYFILLTFSFLIISVLIFIAIIPTTNEHYKSPISNEYNMHEIKNSSNSIYNLSSSIELTASQIRNL